MKYIYLFIYTFFLFTCYSICNIYLCGKISNIKIDSFYKSDIIKNMKLDIKFIGSDKIPYYISMSDTVPTLPYKIPHLILSQGDFLTLHSFLSLENCTRTGDDSMNAIIGLVDNSGTLNNVLKATPSQIGIQTTLAGDTSGGAYYGFSKNGIEFKRGERNSFETTFIFSNHKGLPGQVLTIGANGDTAIWASKTSAPMFQQYFSPKSGQIVSMEMYAYNIVNPTSGLLTLTMSLPDAPNNGDWFEVTFTQSVKSIIYTRGKVANNALKSASLNNYYKKYVYRKVDEIWY
jgi:hypothetical protein